MGSPLKRRLFLSHFLAVVLVSGSIGTVFYKSAIDSLMESLRTRLRSSAALLAPTLDARELEELDATADVDLPVYHDYLARLRSFQSANPDVAFIYLMRLDGDRVRFVVDSDPSPEQAMPGQPYLEEVPGLLAGFTEISADPEITLDEWGSFLSGYAPIRNGGGRYLVGIDMRADEVARKLRYVRIAGVASLAASVVLAWIASQVLARRITRPILALADDARRIARGERPAARDIRTGDEIEELSRAFAAMESGLATSRAEREHAYAELEQAHTGLEERVRERTSRLEELNLQLAGEVAERRRAEAALARAATTDYLTGLLNRRAMVALLEQEALRIRRSHRPFSLLLLDLDHFKAVNDEHGHEVGDRALVEVAERLRLAVRSQDAISRWGGEEVLVFLPETPSHGAAVAAEKLRAAVAGEPLSVLGHRAPLTASLGVSTLAEGETIEECLRRADAALYRAKAEGRDRVVVA